MSPFSFVSGFGAMSITMIIITQSLQETASAVLGPAQSDFDDYRFDGGFCEYYQLIEPGNRSYYLYSPGYPDSYRVDRQDRECRWFAKTPSPTDRLVLDCHEFDLPEVTIFAISDRDHSEFFLFFLTS